MWSSKGSPRYVKSYPEIVIEETSPVVGRKEYSGDIQTQLNHAIVIDNGSGSMKIGIFYLRFLFNRTRVVWGNQSSCCIFFNSRKTKVLCSWITWYEHY